MSISLCANFGDIEEPYIWAGCNQAKVDDRKIRDFRDRTIWQN